MTRELECQTNLEKKATMEKLPVLDVVALHAALLMPHGEVFDSDETAWDAFKAYKVDLNNRASTWNRLETEVDIKVLTGLLFEWLEHLKSPILGRDGITYVVIHCDNVSELLFTFLHFVYLFTLPHSTLPSSPSL